MKGILTIWRRELISFFTTPVAYVFLCLFLLLAGTLTFYVGGFFVRNQADLQVFFNFHPWLYLLFIPTLTMRVWAEERRSGSIEVLLTLPLSPWQIILGKFLAVWSFAGLALVCTTPLWITVGLLGDPDNGVIISGYLASWLLAGGMSAMGLAMSSLTRNPVIAFMGGAMVAFLFTVFGTTLVVDALDGWLPTGLLDALGNLSVVQHFNLMRRGVISLPGLTFFAALIWLFLYLNLLFIESRKAS